MKRILITVAIVNTLTSLSLNSCKKNDVLPDAPGGSTGNSRHATDTINLVASQWRRDAYGVFSTTFPNVIPLNSWGPVKIYVMAKDHRIQINQVISFMNGELWATNTQVDVSVYYLGSSKDLTYLNIQVVTG